MADKKITTVDTIDTLPEDGSVFVSDGTNIMQISKQNAKKTLGIDELNKTLDYQNQLLSGDNIERKSYFMNWILGTIDNEGYESPDANTKRQKTTDYFEVTYEKSVNCADGYFVNVARYNKSGTFISLSKWVQSYDFTNDTSELKYRFIVKKADESVFSETIPDLLTFNATSPLHKYVVFDDANKLNIRKDNGKLVAYESDKISNDYCGISYTDIFEEGNLIAGGDFETDVLLKNAYAINGSPVISDEDSYTGTHSLKCAGSESTNIRVRLNATEGTTYFYACMVKLDRCNVGCAGIQFYNQAVINTVTDGDYIMLGGIFKNPREQVIAAVIGTMGSADADAYIDNCVVVNVDETFVNVPFPEDYELLYMYSEYVRAIKGESTSQKKYTTAIRTELEISEKNAMLAFVNKMIKKSYDLGFDSHIFAMPHSNSQITAMDILRIGINAASYPQLCRIWNKNDYVLRIFGENCRDENIVSTVQDTVFERSYYILGGKTGTSENNCSLLIIGENKHGSVYIGAITGALTTEARWGAMKELFDIATAYEENSEYDIQNAVVTNAPYCAICKYPSVPTSMLYNHPIVPIFQQDANIPNTVASLTKAMSVITGLDYITDIHETMYITEMDVLGATGEAVKAGDMLTIEDALHAMMLPSSNIAARAFGRTIGEKILNCSSNIF